VLSAEEVLLAGPLVEDDEALWLLLRDKDAGMVGLMSLGESDKAGFPESP
jgi:hypothetical protein